jgi:hypothetical protein
MQEQGAEADGEGADEQHLSSMRTEMNKRKHQGPSHTRRKQLRFGLQQQRLAQAKAKATELELRLKDCETVAMQAKAKATELELRLKDCETVAICPDDELDDSELCILCLDAKLTHVCVPCGHRVLCDSCNALETFTECPFCRKPCQQMMKFY